jgi:hypothetical protein
MDSFLQTAGLEKFTRAKSYAANVKYPMRNLWRYCRYGAFVLFCFSLLSKNESRRIVDVIC